VCFGDLNYHGVIEVIPLVVESVLGGSHQVSEGYASMMVVDSIQLVGSGLGGVEVFFNEAVLLQVEDKRVVDHVVSLVLVAIRVRSDSLKVYDKRLRASRDVKSPFVALSFASDAVPAAHLVLQSVKAVLELHNVILVLSLVSTGDFDRPEVRYR